MNSSDVKTIEPYRFFFPISILGAMVGVSVWIFAWLLQKQWIQFTVNPYPVIHHINLITVFFLLPVAKGFIFTAIPRFTGTNFVTNKELTLLSLLQFLILAFVFFYEDSFLFYSFQSLDFGILFLFLIHRFKISKVKLSSYLHFLSGGFFLGLLGSIFQLSSIIFQSSLLFQYGKDFIFYGMIPCIIFGTGTRMLPMIVNTENPAAKMEWMKKAEDQKLAKPFIFLLITSFLFEIILAYLSISYIPIILKGIRFIIYTIWIIQFFHIFEFSNFKGKLARTLLISCYLFILGLAGYSFGLNYSAHLAHIYLIGGLSLLVLSIMTRVTLSHGGGDMLQEKTSNVFYVIAGLVFFAAFTRGFVFVFPGSINSHLAYAGILFITAILVWLIKFGRVIFK